MNRVCRCGEPLAKWRRTCAPCGDLRYVFKKYVSGQQAAGSAVARARRRGELAPASNFPCTDCGAQASAYDHRDYSFPLVVEPVCCGCNVRRGAAKPRTWTLAEYLEWHRNSINNKYVKNAHVLTRVRLDLIEKAFYWHRIWPELAD